MGLKSWDDEPLRPVIESMFAELDPSLLVSRSLSVDGPSLRFNGMDRPGWDPCGSLELDGGRLSVIAVGKAAPSMMAGAFRSFGGTGIEFGPMLCLSSWTVPSGKKYPGVTYLKGDHPLPGTSTARNVRRLYDTISDLQGDDNVLFLLSGGASSLTYSPVEGLTPSLKVDVIRRLIMSGADIEELNTVRRGLSGSKGGGLLKGFRGKGWVTLTLSDVMSDDPRFVGSGLTYPWSVGTITLREVLERYLDDEEHIGMLVEASGRVSRAGDRTGLHNLRNILLANNTTAVSVLAAGLRGAGLSVTSSDERFTGYAGTVARSLLERARSETHEEGLDAFLTGGEATVKVKGDGRGGRCSEMALTVMELLEDGEVAAFISTDGVDGTWDGGGAIARRCDVPSVVIRDHLERNDSGSFFDSYGGKMACGPTGNNLGDIFLFVRSRS